MLFLLDASVLITANNTYYPIERVPEFWEWLAHQATLGLIKLPLEIFEEVLPGRKNDDPLPGWITDHRDVLLLAEAADPALVQRVVNEGYAPDLTDDELEEIGRDPFLIAYGMAGPDRCVVTSEPSSPKKHGRTDEFLMSAIRLVLRVTTRFMRTRRSASAPRGNDRLNVLGYPEPNVLTQFRLQPEQNLRRSQFED